MQHSYKRGAQAALGIALIMPATSCKFSRSRIESLDTQACNKNRDPTAKRWYDPYQTKDFAICEKNEGYVNIANGWGYKADGEGDDRSCITQDEATMRTNERCKG